MLNILLCYYYLTKLRVLIEQCNNIATLEAVLHKLAVGELVNVEVYVELANSEVQEVTTKYGIKRKRDVKVNNNSCDDNVRFTI